MGRKPSQDTIQSAGVTPQVNLRITQAREHTETGSTLALKTQGRCHQKSKTGVSEVPHEKDLCPLQILKKEKKEKTLNLLQPITTII